MCQHENHTECQHAECQNEQQIEARLLSEEEMIEVKGRGFWVALQAFTLGWTIADITDTVSKAAGTAYGKAVTDTSGGTQGPQTGPNSGYWMCNQDPCICGACGQSGGNGPWF